MQLALELNTAMMNVYPCMKLPGSYLYSEAKNKFMANDTVEGAELAFEIGPKILKDISKKYNKFYHKSYFNNLKNITYEAAKVVLNDCNNVEIKPIPPTPNNIPSLTSGSSTLVAINDIVEATPVTIIPLIANLFANPFHWLPLALILDLSILYAFCYILSQNLLLRHLHLQHFYCCLLLVQNHLKWEEAP